ncbi:hypothetical protein [Pseudonocardia sp. WMMC193]|uniref:hypothetical protein n=1 Tax=Pseudonocardia sp. WMMC193 TaxID=2911965 RepID=UPI001F35C651|nr:hypothetical protein [Pseudonocardia sp. WMMC193]MCF7548904.1 hypothetical protein [Pseudonocardia sp. WMMC193]
MIWPPSLNDLKDEMGVRWDDHRDDDPLYWALRAACTYVERVRDDLDFTMDTTIVEDVVYRDLWVGTLRLAQRWYERRKSPAGLTSMADMGGVRVPSVDPDIDRMLRIGRYRRPVIA